MASHKTFDAKFLASYTQQYATDSELRSPNLSDVMSADRLLMEKIYQLANKENWNLDDALHEYSTVRHDMVAILQPRPRTSSPVAPMKGGKGQRERTPPPQRRESKRKSDRKEDKKRSTLDGVLRQILVYARDRSGRPHEAHLHSPQFITVHLAKMRFRSLLPCPKI